MLIGYARCSRPDQDVSLQLDALRQAGCERIFVEHASGTKIDRPELKAMLDFARGGQDQIVCWKIDRLGRGARQLLETVESLQVRGIGLRSLTENIDTTTASGRLVLNIFAVLAQAEADAIRERTRAGLAAAAARGRKGGRPKKLTPTQIEMARTLMADGSATIRQIADQLQVGVSTLYRSIAA